MIIFTVLYAGRRISRRFSPTEAFAAVLELRARRSTLVGGCTLILEDVGSNVTHVFRLPALSQETADAARI